MWQARSVTEDPKTTPEAEAAARATVDALLAAAGIDVPAPERGRLARLYPGVRASADRFHRIDVGDGVQAGIHRPGEGTTGGRAR